MFGKNRKQEGMQTPEEAGGPRNEPPMRRPEGDQQGWGHGMQDPRDYPPNDRTRHPSNEDRDQGMRRP